MQRKVIEVEIVSPVLDEEEFQNAKQAVSETIREIYKKKGNTAIDVREQTNVLINTGGFSFGDKIDKIRKAPQRPFPNIPQVPGDWPPGIEWTCKANEKPPMNLCQVKKASAKNK